MKYSKAQNQKMYFDLHKESTTIRNTIDALIAHTAIHYDLQLLHNDADFDYIAERVPGLQIV